MAVSNYNYLQTFTCSVDTTDAEGKGCIFDSTNAGQVTTTCTANKAILGVVVIGAPAGQEISVMTYPGQKVVALAAGAIAAGANVAVTATGAFQTASGDSTIVVGYAEDATTAANQYFTLVLA